MNVANDFSLRVVTHSESLNWITSPMPGVYRKPLDRVGDEVARATSIVRYAPGSEFSPHVHTGGEEFIVLEGTFQDEHGDFSTGSYIRNPPQSKHKPGSKSGCVIFVKLWQFQDDDRTHLRLQTHSMEGITHPELDNIMVTPLYKDDIEEVAIWDIAPKADLSFSVKGGAELLVLEGSLGEQTDTLGKYSWLRAPVHSNLNIKAGKKGAKIWIKTGHLTDVKHQILRVKNA